ncbi:MAG: hypothetical protein V1688_02550, partial [bacterium]
SNSASGTGTAPASDSQVGICSVAKTDGCCWLGVVAKAGAEAIMTAKNDTSKNKTKKLFFNILKPSKLKCLFYLQVKQK